LVDHSKLEIPQLGDDKREYFGYIVAIEIENFEVKKLEIPCTKT